MLFVCTVTFERRVSFFCYKKGEEKKELSQYLLKFWQKVCECHFFATRGNEISQFVEFEIKVVRVGSEITVGLLDFNTGRSGEVDLMTEGRIHRAFFSGIR